MARLWLRLAGRLGLRRPSREFLLRAWRRQGLRPEQHVVDEGGVARLLAEATARP